MTKKKVKRMKKSGPADGGQEALSFEQALARLEQTITQLEDGQLGLDESLAQYEAGIRYLKLCYRQLERAERKIELLAGIDQQGVAQLEPFDESEMSLEQKQAARSSRRSRSAGAQGRPPHTMDDPGTLF